MNNQGLRGFVGQSMAGRRPDLSPLVYSYTAGATADASYTFTAPTSGWYRFVMWGPGGTNGSGVFSGGGGGALVIAERVLSAGQTVSLVAGYGSFTTNNATTATFPSGEVLSAGAGASTGVSSAGGVATCNANVGDIGVNGNTGAGTTTGGGVAGASSGNYRGGPAGVYDTTKSGATPGASSTGVASGSGRAGDGLIIVTQTRLRQ